MRVMLDTNVLLSALLFPNNRMNGMMRCIFEEHRLVLSSLSVDELILVVKKNFPAKAAIVDHMLSAMSYEFIYTSRAMEQDCSGIANPRNYPLLPVALQDNVDLLITNDKEFAEIALDRPEILTPAEFIRQYLIR